MRCYKKSRAYGFICYISSYSECTQGKHCEEKEEQKGEIYDAERLYVFFCLLRIARREFSEGDQTCKRGYESSDTSDVDTDEKIPVIISKLREKYCRGDVADKLAGYGRGEKSTFLHK